MKKKKLQWLSIQPWALLSSCFKLKQVLDGSSSFSVPWAPLEPAQRHTATATGHPNPPGTREIPGTAVPKQARAAPSVVAAGRFHHGTAVCQQHTGMSNSITTFAFSQIGSTTTKPSTLGTSSRLFWKKSKLPQCDGFFCTGFAYLQVFFFWPSLPLFLSSAPWPLHILGAKIHPRTFYHFFRSRAALLAQHQLQREASSRPKQEPQITLPPMGSGKGRIKTQPKVHSLLKALAGYYVFLKISS